MSRLLNKNKMTQSYYKDTTLENADGKEGSKMKLKHSHDEDISEDEELFVVEVEFDRKNFETRINPTTKKSGNKVNAAITLNYIMQNFIKRICLNKLKKQSYKAHKSYKRREENIFGVVCQSEKVFKRERTPDFNGRECLTHKLHKSLTNISDCKLRKTASGRHRKRHSLKSQAQLGKIIQNIVKNDNELKSSIDLSFEQSKKTEKNLIDFDLSELDIEDNMDYDLAPSKQLSLDMNNRSHSELSPLKDLDILKSFQSPDKRSISDNTYDTAGSDKRANSLLWEEDACTSI